MYIYLLIVAVVALMFCLKTKGVSDVMFKTNKPMFGYIVLLSQYALASNAIAYIFYFLVLARY